MSFFGIIVMSTAEFQKVVKRFYDLQDERAQAYKLFEEGHEAYLRTGPHYDFEHYKLLVHEITQAFSGISKEILEIKLRLHEDFDRPDLSEHVEKLQFREKTKLEQTAKLQLAKQNALEHPDDEDCQEKIREIRQHIIKNQEALGEILQDFKYDSEEPE
ncbi:required for excision 1-B domain-containing protein [Brienomyrus brachyistius]|uniref:required for excision 1-B domain-containing protein n=1 Tax=Brienomyrus brachyistius TaxID=42636 RepID=UPI0020B36BF8|nr:required for excision 1-B domain-containing protein [Brienomyrus brachyistius]